MFVLPGDPAPAFGTPLTPGRKNLLPEARRIAKLLGFDELCPWQEYVLALATEYEEVEEVRERGADGRVRVRERIIPWYRVLVLSVPRQTGKTEVVGLVLFCLRWEGLMVDFPAMMIYMAQTQSDAMRVAETKWHTRLKGCPWGRAHSVYFSSSANDPHLRTGGKRVRDMSRGRVSILANKSGSGLGLTSSFLFLDEAREFGDASREDAILPQMNTLVGPQMVVCSTMGGTGSVYFNEKVDAGRLLVGRQLLGEMAGSRRAYVEYGVGDVGSDDYDPADRTMWQTHPLLGRCNWTLERMAEEFDRALAENNLDGFRNNYLNQRLAVSDKPAIPAEWLDECEKAAADGAELDFGSPAILGLNAAPDSEYVGAAVAGNGCLRVVLSAGERGAPVRVGKYGVGEWLTGWLTANPGVRRVAVMRDGEVDAALVGWRHSGVVVDRVAFGEFRGQCSTFLAAVSEGKMRLVRSEWFRLAVTCAMRQEASLGQSWYWRRKPEVDKPIDELVAATLAWGGWQTLAARPKVRLV